MRLWGWRRRREQELDDEIQAHLAMATRDRIARGEAPAQAGWSARRELGNRALIGEVTRGMWPGAGFERLARDLRYSLRLMRRNPGFTAVAALSLALGIGANTAIFSLIDTLMLRALPVRDPASLVELQTRFTPRFRFNAFSWPTYEDLRDHNHVFSGLIAAPDGPFYVQVRGMETEKVEGQFVSGDFFPVLGVQPALGRLIAPEDDRANAPATAAVVSWAYWKNRLGGDASILGKQIVVEDRPATIIGVTPPGFFGLQTGARTDISIPMAMMPAIRHRGREDAGSKYIRLAARLKPGVSIEQARAEMNVLFRRTLEAEARIGDNHKIPDWSIEVEPAGSGLSRLRDQFSKPLVLLMGVVSLLLLIACANVASLLLARAAARRREMAVRVALGAGRGNIVRQVLTESLVLSTIAGALGTLLAWLGTTRLVALMNTGRMPISLDVRPDARVLAFTIGVSVLTGVLFGLAPAMRAMAASPAPSLREAARTGETGLRRLYSRALVVSQVALSVVLLAVSAAFARNLIAVENLNLGFSRDHVLLVSLDPFHGGFTPKQLALQYQDLLRRWQSIPGVRSASVAWIAPISGGGAMRTPTAIDGRAPTPAEKRTAYTNWVGPRYFETMGTPLVAGRDFSVGARADAPPEAIINQTMARICFSGDPIGRHITFGDDGTYEVIGVSGDAKYLQIREDTPPTLFINAFQVPHAAAQFVLRTAVPPASVTPEVWRAARELLKGAAIGNATTLDAHIDASFVEERMIAVLSSLFGALGSALTAIGLYGLLAYAVTRRTGEIGIRMVLGAKRFDIVRMVLGEAALLVSLGLATGSLLAAGARRVAGAMVPNLQAAGAAAIAFGAAAMIAIGLVAAYLPARRAARVEPIEALRFE